jgi:hypothetical protein
LQLYSFPLTGVGILQVSNWIKEEAFDRVYPHRECPDALANLRQRFDLLDNVRVYDAKQVFGPSYAVEALVTSLTSVWEKRLGSPLRIMELTPDDDLAARGMLLRLKQLYSLCSFAWESSEILCDIFDTLYKRLHCASKYQFELVSTFLEEVLAISTSIDLPGDSKVAYFFEHPRLTSAIDSVFRYAVLHDLQDSAYRWLETWKTIRLYKGCCQWQNIDSSLLPFLVRYAVGCEPPKTISGFKVKPAERVSRLCSFTRELIEMTDSAVHEQGIFCTLIDVRPDVLARLILKHKDGGSSIEGTFCRKGSMGLTTLLYSYISASQVQSFPSAVARLYAACALERSRNVSLTIKDRTLAMERFITCPSTSSSNILDALRDDTLEVPLIEAVTLRIFELDSPWHVLAHLLSVPVLEQKGQRTTASLLAHVPKHVQVNLVVKTLGLLLDHSRRRVLTVTEIIRMLFDAGTDEAKELLKTEWERDIHIDVRHALLISCLRAAVSKDTSVEFEWGVLENLARSKTTEDSTSLLLLAVLADQSTIHSLSNRWNVGLHQFNAPPEEPSVVEIRGMFNHCFSASHGHEALIRLDRFRAWTEQLSRNLAQVDLRLIALRAKWRLARLYHDPDVMHDSQGNIGGN